MFELMSTCKNANCEMLYLCVKSVSNVQVWQLRIGQQYWLFLYIWQQNRVQGQLTHKASVLKFHQICSFFLSLWVIVTFFLFYFLFLQFSRICGLFCLQIKTHFSHQQSSKKKLWVWDSSVRPGDCGPASDKLGQKFCGTSKGMCLAFCTPGKAMCALFSCW